MVDSIFRSRLTSEHWGNTTDYFMYTYDAVGNLLYATDGQHAYSYAYDALNRPIYTTFNFDSQSAVFAYTYDLAGRRTSSSLSLNGHSDRVNQTTYDFLGNATSIRQTGSAVDEIFAEFDYNANGLMTSVKRYEVDGNNLINEIAESLYTYNANNAVTSITHKNPNGTQIVQHSYTYDETNNIVEYLNSIDGSTTYNYDFLGQLIGADYANQNLDDETYTYDENGNRITANGDTYTTGDNNELTSDGTWTYTYDAEGNRISKTNATNRELYTWDHRNRLTTVTKQTYDTTTATWTTVQIVEYTYDYNNIWIRKTVDTNGDGTADSKSIFIPEAYQAAVQLDDTDLTDSAGPTVTHHYLWTPNTQDKLIADTTPTEVLWSLTDHLGTIRDVLGATTTHLIYDAFGNLISGTNPLLFGFTGKAFDTDTNLQNNINRWYDALIGRWLSVDPIGFEGNDTNLYRYVENGPVYFYDFWGLWKRISPRSTYFYSDSNNDSFDSLYEEVRRLFPSQIRSGTVEELRYCVIPYFFKHNEIKIDGKKVSLASAEDMENAWNAGEIAKCGVYDISFMLKKNKGRRVYFSIGHDFNEMENPFIKIVSRKLDVSTKLMPSNIFSFLDNIVQKQGAISRLYIIGHSNGTEIGGVSAADRNAETVLFTAQTLGDPYARRSWQDAKSGKVPPIAWFSSNAEVIFWGCNTKQLAQDFAALYLLDGAIAMGTSKYLWVNQSRYYFCEEIPNTNPKKYKTVGIADLQSEYWEKFKAKGVFTR